MKTFPALGVFSTLLLSVLANSGTTQAQTTDWPRSIMLGTASPGGVYLVYGQGLARILSRDLRIEIAPQATQGPAQNIVLMEKKEAMLGFITMGVGLQGWNGDDWAKKVKYRAMRAIFPMYDTPFQFAVPKRLAIKSLNELAGLRIGVGPRAGTGGTYIPEMFKILGITASFRFGPFEQMAALTASGELDGVALATGSPADAIAELDAKLPLDFIDPTPEQIAVIRKQMPEITPSLIPAGTYRSLTKDYPTIGLYNFAIAHKDLPDELVYRLVKAVFENHEELVKAHPAAKETIPRNVDRNTFLPLHPGAVRYYREIGITIPPGVLQVIN